MAESDVITPSHVNFNSSFNMRNTVELKVIEEAADWFGYKTPFGMSEEDIFKQHRRIRNCLGQMEVVKEMKEGLVLNEYYRNVLLSVIRRESFEMWDMNTAFFSETIRDVRPKIKATEVYKQAFYPDHKVEEFKGGWKLRDKKFMLGVDVTNPLYKDSIYAADPPIDHNPIKFIGLFVSDTKQKELNDKVNANLHEMVKDDPLADGYENRDWNFRDERINFEEIQAEYANFRHKDLVLLPCKDLIPAIKARETREIDPKGSTQKSDENERNSSSFDSAVFNYGPLFYDKKPLFKCDKPKERSKMGHHSRNILTGDKFEYLKRCQSKFVINKDSKKQFNRCKIEAVAYAMIERNKRDWIKHGKQEVLKDESDKSKKISLFWETDDFFEQLGKAFLKAAKLAVVILNRRTRKVIYCPYILFYRYINQLIEKSELSGKPKTSYRCLNKCPTLDKVTRDDIEKHYEYQITEAMICIEEGCGRQFSFSSSFSAHYTKYHILQGAEFEKFKISVIKRAREMEDGGMNKLFQAIDHNILGKDLNRPVQLPFPAPSYTSQGSSLATGAGSQGRICGPSPRACHQVQQMENEDSGESTDEENPDDAKIMHTGLTDVELSSDEDADEYQDADEYHDAEIMSDGLAGIDLDSFDEDKDSKRGRKEYSTDESGSPVKRNKKRRSETIIEIAD